MDTTTAKTILNIKFARNEDVQKAYKSLSHIHHPDKGGSAVEFNRIREAKDFLLSLPKEEINKETWSEYITKHKPRYYRENFDGTATIVYVTKPKITGIGTPDNSLIEGTFEKIQFGNNLIITPKHD